MPRPRRSRVAPARPTVAAETVQQDLAPSDGKHDAASREPESVAVESQSSNLTEPHRARASMLKLDSDQTRALEESKQREDEAMARLDDLSSTSRPEQPESADNERESPARGRPRLTDVSGLDLEDLSLGNLDDSLDDSEDAIDDTRTGYRSTDTSTFSISMFKRGRPRQSSVAGRDDAPIRPSSRGQNTPSISTTLNFSNFRRRAREPSILSSVRKPMRHRSQSVTSQASRAASVLEDGDDSGPDGESTPVDKTRRQTRASQATEAANDDLHVCPSRKRKSLESHENYREKRPALDVSEPDEVPKPEEVLPSIEVDHEPVPASSPTRGRTRERERLSTPAQPPAAEDDPDMAPPMSSSASASNSPVAWPSLDALAHRNYTRKPPPRPETPELIDSSSELSSPPSLTHSPNYPTAAAKAAAARKKASVQPPAAKKLTTADLTSLLPQRRKKSAKRQESIDNDDPFDVDGSSDEERYVADPEDVSYVQARTSRRKKQPLSKSASNRKGKEKEVNGKADGGKKKAVRTYGSAKQQDKENEEVVAEEIVVGGAGNEDDEVESLPEEETTQMLTERIGEELAKAKKKFKEVDKWELSFEEVGPECSSPDPYAR
ncbi:uncharacterized protein CTHT_0022460 [Thermochaetoides thermophila DSM 1495]|uniref:Uncharacterized protein n=1 Tax=Chaetomium thermophilum (strain DSM 1495 / CBS 144.50 / IMI 039719) TaxID=759272 RepID=G0S4D8_CHATD|nr:hypothetical protein CTHT_0022460 [Thermochaetoides thermophila DSM 1495]EGS20416.1 hypothetical protein CTHT_0022460 [Thermochaetoides thermophila DSM 1495]